MVKFLNQGEKIKEKDRGNNDSVVNVVVILRKDKNHYKSRSKWRRCYRQCGEIIGNSDLSKNKAPAPVKETFWENYGAKICVAGSLVMVFAVICLYYVKLIKLQYRTGQF
jgi:hypothetical protein